MCAARVANALPVLMQRLACMDLVRRGGVGLYEAATGAGDRPLDPVEQFMVEDWLADLERKRAEAAAAGAEREVTRLARNVELRTGLALAAAALLLLTGGYALGRWDGAGAAAVKAEALGGAALLAQVAELKTSPPCAGTATGVPISRMVRSPAPCRRCGSGAHPGERLPARSGHAAARPSRLAGYPSGSASACRPCRKSTAFCAKAAAVNTARLSACSNRSQCAR